MSAKTKRVGERQAGDVAKLGDVVRLINVALARYEAKHAPWYKRLWRTIRRAA